VLTLGGFKSERLSLWFYVPRILLTLLRFGIGVSLGYAIVHAIEPLQKYTSLVATGVDSLIYFVIGTDAGVSMRKLRKANYYETRFRQLVFRFSAATIFLLLLILFVITQIVRIQIVFWQTQDWVVSMLLLGPMLLAVAFIVFFIVYLPPNRDIPFLAKLFLNRHSAFPVPWGDVSLASVASHDCYYDHPADESSGSGSGPLDWTREGLRVLGWVRNDTADAHLLITEVTPATARCECDEGGCHWRMRTGDLVIAFRGTGSSKNALTDLTICRTSLPMTIVAPGHSVRGQRGGVPPSDVDAGRHHQPRMSLDLKSITRSERKHKAKTSQAQVPGRGKNQGRGGGGGIGGEAAGGSEGDEDDKSSGDHSARDYQHHKAAPDRKETNNPAEGERNKDRVTIVIDGEQKDVGKDTFKRFSVRRQLSFWRSMHANGHAGRAAGVWHWLTAGTVHSGFLKHYMALREPLLEALDALLAPESFYPVRHASAVTEYHELQKPMFFRPTSLRMSDRKRTILITGHSLGAAVSTIGALDISTRYKDEYNIRLINLASPRVGDHRFARLFNHHVPDAIRVVIDRDMIPSVPQSIFSYKHVGHEAFLDTKGNVIIDRTPIEKLCMRGGAGRVSSHSFKAYDKGIYRHMALLGLDKMKEQFLRCWEVRSQEMDSFQTFCLDCGEDEG